MTMPVADPIVPDPVDAETLRYLWAPDLDPLFWREGRSGVLSAWYGHLPFAHWIVRAVRPLTIVELGTHYGVSYCAFCQAVARNSLNTRCFAVDTWKGDSQTGFYGEEVYQSLRRFHDERYSAFSELLRCTFDDALAYLADGSVDLLHIDGLHTYEAVHHDFENWRPKLSENAVVLFHDTNERQRDFGVWRLWEELSKEFPAFEFLHGHGLGVLAVGDSMSPEVRSLCSLREPAYVNAVRQRFSVLGERWTLLSQFEQINQLHASELAARDAIIQRLQATEAAAVEQNNQLHASEVAAKDARIQWLEAEAVRLKAEAARRSAAEIQLRARAAYQTRKARAVAANALARVAEVALKRVTATQSVAAAAALSEDADKLRRVEDLRRELQDFLEKHRRLSFPANDQPDVSIIVVLFNQAQFTLRCLQKILLQSSAGYEVILVDNCSTDETPALLRRLDNVLVISNQENAGFLLAVNQAAARATGRSILLLNSDAFMRENAMSIALQTLESDPQIGAVGGRLILPSGRLQEAGSIIWSDASALGYGRGLAAEAAEAMFRRDVDYCSGAFLLTPRAIFERLGGFDPYYVPAYYEEADYCLRLWESGLRVVYEPRAVIDHYEFGSQTSDGVANELCLRNRKRLRSRHAATLRSRHLPPSEGNLLFARDNHRVSRRLLIIDNEIPFCWLGRGNPRMAAVLKETVAEGWFVTLYPILPGDIDWPMVHAEFPVEIEIYHGRGAPGLPAFLSERRGYYDVVLISRPENMAAFVDATRDRLDLLGGARLIYDAEALSFARSIAKSQLEGHQMSKADADALISQELRLTEGVDTILAVTASEAEVFRNRTGESVHVLCHPVDIIRNTPGFSERSGFLFVGRLLEKDSPNYEGLTWFIRSVWRKIRSALGDATLEVVGSLNSDHSELLAPGVHLVGKVEDLQPFYNKARIFVAPVRFAAGIPIKVLDAGAAGLPVIATKLMATLLGWEPDLEIVAKDDPQEMANATIGLYGDPARWKTMQETIRDRLKRDHSKARFRRELRAILDGNFGPACANKSKGEIDAYRIARVNTVWRAEEPVHGRGGYWMANPMVRDCVNFRASGDSATDCYARLSRLLAEMGWSLPAGLAISLCCGGGELERGLAQLGIAEKIIGYDLSEPAIRKARAAATSAELDHLVYEVRDLEHDGLAKTNVDLVFAHSAVHHISRLEALFDAVHAALRPGGIFHLNEYVGPDRFQWTDRQIVEINDFFERLPERYKRLPDGGLRSPMTRPRIEDMKKHDPSESVRSSEIERLVAERFHIVERRPLGGTLLHMGLHEIAQNFDPAKDEDRAHLQRLIDREEQLMADQSISSDFLVLIAQRSE
jgi:GT2 family glycosyltransferase/SAM-dependent methyltransferase